MEFDKTRRGRGMWDAEVCGSKGCVGLGYGV